MTIIKNLEFLPKDAWEEDSERPTKPPMSDIAYLQQSRVRVGSGEHQTIDYTDEWRVADKTAQMQHRDNWWASVNNMTIEQAQVFSDTIREKFGLVFTATEIMTRVDEVVNAIEEKRAEDEEIKFTPSIERVNVPLGKMEPSTLDGKFVLPNALAKDDETYLDNQGFEDSPFEGMRRPISAKHIAVGRDRKEPAQVEREWRGRKRDKQKRQANKDIDL